MATVSGAGGDISVAFLQQNGDDPFTATPERTAQIAGVAKLIADFIAGARKSLDIAIYDFRLGDDAAATVSAALRKCASNNVAIRIIYDATTEPQANGSPELPPAHLEADRKAPGTETFVNSFADIAQIKPVTGYRVLMHSKYLIRDADSDDAAVSLGSANYTNDSWGLQESNLLQIRSRPLASIFTDNFAGLFATGRVPDNQTNRDVDSVDVSGVPVKVGFAPKQSPAIVKEIVGDGDGTGRIRNIDRVAVRSGCPSLAGKIVTGNDTLLDRNRVGWRIQKGVVLDCYILIRTNPDIFLSRRFAACESAVLHGGAASQVVYCPKTRRVSECAVLYRDIVGLDDHRRATEIDAAEHSACLSDVYNICGWRIIVGRFVVLGDFRDVEQRRRRVRIAGHRVDAWQDRARVVVADFVDLCGGDHAIVPRSQRGKARWAEQ